ncbi:hypothetical protein [Actinomyces sp.]|uniref:hypothetical protein n=1 Tax=Actinomyces sp. TaxID=29317 RepID=UPI0029138C85|nr:hypothetical protein [Actinomyces sp.]MDU7239793.1 hypothetical protein [Actinomyces sp.]
MIDISGLTVSELDTLIRAAQERKSDLEYIEQFSQLISVYQSQYLTLRDAVKVEGARWREPDPARYETWYAAGDIVTYDGKRYKSLISFNTFAPDVSGAWQPA